MSRVPSSPHAVRRARELLASGLHGSWKDAARRFSAGGVGFEREVVRLLAQQIEAYDALQARHQALLTSHGQVRDRLERIIMAEAEENERLRDLLDTQKPRPVNRTGLQRLGLKP